MKPYLMHHYLDEHALRSPAKVACVDGNQKMSYRQLWEESNRLARCLKDLNVGRQDTVAFCLRRSVNCLVAITGILKAEAVYVPVDHKAPRERGKNIVTDCRPKAILCDERTLKHVRSILAGGAFRVPILCLGESQEGTARDDFVCFYRDLIRGYNEGALSYQIGETDLAYILYTSGSTGKPKGVMISHLNIRKYIEWAVDYFQITDEDKILSTAPFHFDMSTFDVFCSLQAGGTLCIAGDELMLFPAKLMQFLEGQQVTLWKGVSSLLMYMERAGVVKQGRMPNLKKVLFGGEVLPTKYLISWMKTFPDKSFCNIYGPTEATGASLYYAVKEVPCSARERIPIGIPCTDTEVYLLNEEGAPVRTGEIGELCIAGAGLARGYLNDPEKTALAFFDYSVAGGGRERIYRTGDLACLRPDGNYEFISRKDSQVKYMGYRIELGDIESVLGAMDGIEDAAVVLSMPENNELSELVAFFESKKDIQLREILDCLKAQLPFYMVPKRLIKVDFIPRCSRGKIAREKLYPVMQEWKTG